MKLVIFILFILFFVNPSISYAQNVSLEGNWSGGGYLKPNNGEREIVRCRVKYIKYTEKLYEADGKCAHTSGTIYQSGQLTRVSATRFAGDLFNSQYKVSGKVRVVIKGKKQTVTFLSSKGSGKLSLRKK